MSPRGRQTQHPLRAALPRPELAEIEEELEEEELSAEAPALRELHAVEEQLQALAVVIERMATRGR